MNNELFENMKKLHPDWSDAQIWTAISLDMESEKQIEKGGKDIDPNDPGLLKSIVAGARAWLKEVLPIIFEKVKAFFDYIKDHIGEWVAAGLEAVKRWIGEILPTFIGF
ncbi:MAG: hypothetical protein MJZ86_01155 [Bacteroidales bacterium]|nr:hypothetical protein [Bacteroidales bacterium]